MRPDKATLDSAQLLCTEVSTNDDIVYEEKNSFASIYPAFY